MMKHWHEIVPLVGVGSQTGMIANALCANPMAWEPVVKVTLAGLFVLLATNLPAKAQGFDPPVAIDTNPDPTIVEINLSANVTTWQYIPGADTTVWAYSDDSPGGSGASVPGPTIKANVGDTLKVHFTNNLPEPTTIHWHGVETPAGMDGGHITQLHVQPGATFDYEFSLLKEGLYWYHPHVRTHDQVETGLHGGLLVKDPAKDAIVFANLGARQVEEHVVFFDDVLLDANNQVVPAFSFTDPLQNAEYNLNGRVGNVLLVNGRESSGVTLPVTNGAVQNWYIVNVANTTICRLGITRHAVNGGPGIRQDTWEIGSDGGYVEFPYKRFENVSTAPMALGQGNLAHVEESYSGVLLFPGERMQVAFTPIGLDGESFTIEQWDWFRGRRIAVWNAPMTKIKFELDPLDGAYPTVSYFDIALTGNDPGLGQWIPNFLIPFPPLAAPFGLEEQSLAVTFGHGPANPSTGAMTLYAQSTRGDDGVLIPLPTAKVGSFEAHDVNVGDVRKWEITNRTEGEHPFHAHGFFFELIEYEWIDQLVPENNFKFEPLRNRILNLGANSRPRKWKDTIRMPPRLGKPATSKTIGRLRVHFDDTGREGQIVAQGENPTFDANGDYTSGGWLFHCHILEHSANGMLSFFELRDPSSSFVLLGKHLPGLSSPYLTGRGTQATGISLDLVNALPNTIVLLVHGNLVGNNPFAGGTLVPFWYQKAFAKLTDSQGKATWNAGAGAPVDKYWQVVYRDGSGPKGWSMSNALMVR